MVRGDRFIFMKRGENVFLGMRHGIPHRISGQIIVDTVKLANKGSSFYVTFFRIRIGSAVSIWISDRYGQALYCVLLGSMIV